MPAILHDDHLGPLCAQSRNDVLDIRTARLGIGPDHEDGQPNMAPVPIRAADRKGRRIGDDTIDLIGMTSGKFENQSTRIAGAPHEQLARMVMGPGEGERRLEVREGRAISRAAAMRRHRAIGAAIKFATRALVPGNDPKTEAVEPADQRPIFSAPVGARLMKQQNERRILGQTSKIGRNNRLNPVPPPNSSVIAVSLLPETPLKPPSPLVRLWPASGA